MNFIDIYKDRIKEIDKQVIIAVKNKKWVDKAKLEAEKSDLEKRIKQIEGMKHGRKV